MDDDGVGAYQKFTSTNGFIVDEILHDGVFYIARVTVNSSSISINYPKLGESGGTSYAFIDLYK